MRATPAEVSHALEAALATERRVRELDDALRRAIAVEQQGRQQLRVDLDAALAHMRGLVADHVAVDEQQTARIRRLQTAQVEAEAVAMGLTRQMDRVQALLDEERAQVDRSQIATARQGALALLGALSAAATALQWLAPWLTALFGGG